ncbi:hypothetical protein K502DRAFT_339659 [Neoconidiobolus thromboides FSU 785]|nr:hypothetical protein K502DRAFT_339659 [Neoconidiobolus thromboides FSU 785]
MLTKMNEKNADELNINEFNANVNEDAIEEGDIKEEIKPVTIKNKRLLSLDGLRGLVIILMITANYQVINQFPQISHAEWFGFTIADSIFPTFVFMMGLAIPLALNKLPLNGKLILKIIKRSILLWGIGAFLNGWPFTWEGLSDKYRFVGVLHRLALCYLVTSIAYICCRDFENNKLKKYYLYVGFPLIPLIIWLGITFGLNVPDCGRGSLSAECSAQGYIDQLFWGKNHNYQKKDFDPEGVLSMFTACISCWLGLMVGLNVLKNRKNFNDNLMIYQKMAQFLLCALLFLFIAYCFDPIIPVGKPLWTPTFVLCAGGFSLIMLSLLMYFIDILNCLNHPWKIIRFLFKSLLKVGSNPLLIYALSEMVAGTMFAITLNYDGLGSSEGIIDLWSYLYFNIFGKWCPDSLGSLIWSQFFIWIIFVPLAWFLDHKGWYLRV